jgi:hypothetical protein
LGCNPHFIKWSHKNISYGSTKYANSQFNHLCKVFIEVYFVFYFCSFSPVLFHLVDLSNRDRFRTFFRRIRGEFYVFGYGRSRRHVHTIVKARSDCAV